MEKHKEETVARLFALRAGLSAISMQSSMIKMEESAIDAANNKVETIQSRYNEVVRQENGLTDELQDLQKQYDDRINERDREFEQKTKAKHNGPGYKSIASIVCVLSLLFGLPMIVLLALNIVDYTLSIIVIVACTITFVIAIGYYTINVKNVRDKYAAYIDGELLRCSRSMDQAKTALYTAQRNKQELLHDIHDTEQERDRAIDAHNDNISCYAQVATCYNTALEKYFSTLLDPVDWQNADLCIYYLLTGRAQNIRECLQLAKAQRQTDEIASAVKQSSDRICSDIRNGFSDIGDGMIACFDSICTQLESISARIADDNAAVVSALNNINDSNNVVLSTDRLNSALRIKATATSEQLADDVRYIKKYA